MLPAGLGTGRLTLYRSGAPAVPVGMVTGYGLPFDDRLLRADPTVVSVAAALPDVVQIPLLPLACAVVQPTRAPN